MNNNQRRALKKYVKNLVESSTNNKVISSKVISNEEVECICSNRFSKEHIITVILGAKADYVMYDGGVISVDYEAAKTREKKV